MRNSTMCSSEKRYLHHCSLRSEKNQRTWDKLIALMKKVCYQLSPFFARTRRGDPCTNQVQICLKNGNQVATWKTSESGFSLTDKKANSCRSQNRDPEARTSSRFWQKTYPGINWNYWSSANGVSNPGEINYYFKKNHQNKIRLFVKHVSGTCETWKNCRKVTC